MEKDKIKQLTKELLEELGEDINRAGLEETPLRVSNVYKEIFSGTGKTVGDVVKKTFKVEENNLIIHKDISFYSMCEHDFLPFFGSVSIAYYPDGRVLGFGDIVKIVELYSKRLQIQERMTNEICSAILEYTKCKGVMVLSNARHLCMEMRGIKKEGSHILISSVKGIFTDNSELKNEALKFINS